MLHYNFFSQIKLDIERVDDLVKKSICVIMSQAKKILYVREYCVLDIFEEIFCKIMNGDCV